jgi:ADP-heptose:LPS heptosyltransferase
MPPPTARRAQAQAQAQQRPRETRPDAAPASRICVFAQLHGPGLGDMVHRNVLLSLLRRAYPDATITLVVGKALAAQYADLLHGHTYASDLLLCPDPRDGAEEHWQAFLRDVAGRRFQLCVVDPGSHTLGASHAAAAGIGVRMGFRRGDASDRDLTHPITLPPPLFGFPDLYEYASAVAVALGIGGQLRPSDVIPPFPVWPEEAPDLPAAGPRIAVHPTGMPHWNRRWPLASFGELCARMADSLGAGLYLLGTGAELRELSILADAVLERCPAAAVQIEAECSLNRAANLLAGSDLLVGNDSSMLHIAAAVGTPTVVIIGPTGSEPLWTRVYPRHRGVSLYYPCQGILHDVDEVADRRCEHSCAVPYLGPQGPYPRCMTDLGVEQVWAAVTAQLQAYRPAGLRDAHVR